MKAKESGDLLIRILVLPNHLYCCLEPIVEWISKNLGESTRVNLMWQYYPAWRAWEREELKRRLTPEEKKESLEIAEKAGLKNIIT
jgi:putative pyruvate formate lyase activating enzyme